MKSLTYKIIIKKIDENRYLAAAPTILPSAVEAASEEEAVAEVQQAIANAIRAKVAANEEVADDASAQVYNLTIEVSEKPSA